MKESSDSIVTRRWCWLCNDENAPINTIADYVITDNVEDIVPKLIKYYKKNSK